MMIDRAALEEQVLGVLRRHRGGLSEYDLLQSLRGAGFDELVPERFTDSYAMFRAHFLLFHTLYRLRDRLWDGKSGHLSISSLRIALGTYIQGKAELARVDLLREYYLDLSQLESTTAQDVNELLAGGWQRINNNLRRREALAALDLEDPVDDAAITRRYRRLVMRHHPDRGGDIKRLQKINAAMAVLAPRR